MNELKIDRIKKGMHFYENDMRTSIEMIAVEDAKLIPIGDGFKGEMWAVKVLTDRGIIEISQNAKYLDSYLGLKLSIEPNYSEVEKITFLENILKICHICNDYLDEESNKGKCIWNYTEESYYETSCDNAFQFNYEHKEEEFNWCPYCGKEIKEIKSESTDEP